ncbi:flavoprotein [Globomyces pollinis-pini]|nr:flavoprotein [Globomyces pollinis-pini]KAJ2996629.1 hypothetical protein HDV02_006327 [Globomyces sp. JEL0801]
MTINILIGLTGSVATVKIYNLIRDLETSLDDVEIQIVSTETALHFYDPTLIKQKVYRDQDEWKDYTRGDPVLHIDLRNWADVFLIAPMDANTIAKMANGLCDNLLTCILRAWNPKKPVFLAPAMNTAMWEHPITSTQLTQIKSWNFVTIINPITKLLACGDLGIGAMEETNKIAEMLKESLLKSNIVNQDVGDNSSCAK